MTLLRALCLWVLPFLCVGWANPFSEFDCPEISSVIRMENSQDNVEAPSSSPTVAHLCTSHTSNARGHYTSSVAPCVFRFHSSQNIDVAFIDYQTSDLCSEENGFLIMKEYVYDFPDECVGDFQRCYSLEHHQDILLDFLCDKAWNFPEGTTHVSVDCTEDKVLYLESATHEQAEQKKESNEEVLQTYVLKLFNLALILGSSIAGVYVISHWIVKPLVGAEICSCRGTNSGETCQCGSLNPETLNLVSEEESTSSSQDHSEEFDQQIPANFDAIPFVLQAPTDFDGIPIVTATILPHDD